MKHHLALSFSIFLTCFLTGLASCNRPATPSHPDPASRINCSKIEIQDSSQAGLSCTTVMLSSEHQAQLCALAILNNGVECNDIDTLFRITRLNISWVSHSPGAFDVSEGSVTTKYGTAAEVSKPIDKENLAAFAAILKPNYCIHSGCTGMCSGEVCEGEGECNHRVSLAGGAIIAVVSDVDGEE